MFTSAQTDRSAERFRALLERASLPQNVLQSAAVAKVSTKEQRNEGNVSSDAQTRVGPEYQAVIPEFRTANHAERGEDQKDVQITQSASRSESHRLSKDVELWTPSTKLSDSECKSAKTCPLNRY